MLPRTPPYLRSDALNNHIPIFVRFQGTVTPVAPGTKIVSSNVVRLSTDKVFIGIQQITILSIFTPCPSLNIFQTGLPAGVYMLVRHNGSKAVLIVKKAEPSEPIVRVYSDKQASTSLRTLTSANPTATAVRTVLPKIIKPVQFVIKPTNQEVSSSTKPSSSGSTCYGTTKGSGTKTLRRMVPQAQKYQTPLQVVSLLRMISSLDSLSL